MLKLKPMFERLVRRDAEAGQAIVIVALFMLVLVGMLGLALDGGGVFLLYRDARNAADTAALQAAYARCTSPVGSPEYKTAGLNAADENGFRNGSISTITIDDYSIVTGNSSDAGKTYVNIVATKPSYFAQLIFSGPLTIEVDAVAFCDRGFDSGSTPGAIARAEDGVCGSNGEFEFTGSQAIYHGDIYTFGSIRLNGGNAPGNQAVLDGKAEYWGSESDTLADTDKLIMWVTSATNTRAVNYTSAPDESGDVVDLDPADTQNPLLLGIGTALDWSDWEIGGTVYNHMANNLDADGNPYRAFVVNGDWNGTMSVPVDITGLGRSLVNSNGMAEGIVFVDGNADVPKNKLKDVQPMVADTYRFTSDAAWGYLDFSESFRGTNGDITYQGLSIIAESYIQVGSENSGFVRYYDGLDDLETTLGQNLGKPVFASNRQRVDDRCTPSNPNFSLGVSFTQGAYVYGLMWAPEASISNTFNNTGKMRGAMDAFLINFSGASQEFWYDPSLLPARNPSVGQES